VSAFDRVWSLTQVLRGTGQNQNATCSHQSLPYPLLQGREPSVSEMAKTGDRTAKGLAALEAALKQVSTSRPGAP
jgi:hypothetical protein